MRKKKALVLFSGGLDSILTIKILLEQGITVMGVAFKSYFFGVEKAQESAKKLGVSLETIDISEEHLEVVESPKYGRGSGMNPCVDCHLLMLKTAKEIMRKEEFDFAATGDVLGQRPMSQNKRALEFLTKASSLNGYLLRPLCAKLLRETIPEQKGWVDREKFFSINGRSRKKQIELAKQKDIDWYSSPAGGCILCEKEFSKRLKELLDKKSDVQVNDIRLLRLGRHFWTGSNEIIIGRNHGENLEIKRLAKKQDILVELEDAPGPTALIRNYNKKKIPEQALTKAKGLIKKYSKKAKSEEDSNFRIS